ncbi:hypothetical protein [Halotia branconii]|uniref:Uncharacterized protein n=1 Tax=Halotia branconii CENA392 TaxID=1539056 RepID=A0AAJ6P9I0_9CYAN|nr:hypothetical protein [Halotia branconii]WGV25696.1 hypothetical protein QI031_28915 [Halotia branconii CENA392]
MKHPLLSLLAVISAIAFAHPAYANEENVPPMITERHQAAVLVTEPVTINSGTNNALDRTNNLNQAAEEIGSARAGECPKVNPLDLINNPADILKPPCQNQNPQRSAEPVEYFKVPRLDSGISVTVTKF